MNFDKLNEVGLDSISLKVYTNMSNMNYINSNIENWIQSQEIDSKYIIDIYIDILGIKTDSDKEIEIGKLEGNLLEADIVMDDANFYDVCDCVGADLEALASAIVDSDGYIREEICEYDENLMYIDRIYIEEKYRGLGIASYILNSLNEILEYSTNLNPHALILLPKPQEKNKENRLANVSDKDKEKIYKYKLINLYRRLGFKKVINSEYMVKRVREKLKGQKIL